MGRQLLATAVLVFGAMTVGFTTQSRPDTVSGTLSRTFSIVANTDLTGDVTCAVADGTPCFSFAVGGVELRLNGFSITGKGDAVMGCGGGVTAGEVGITTNAQSGIAVSGPGLVQRFRNHGIQVTGSSHARIAGVTVSTNCGSGIFVVGNSFNTMVEENTALRNGTSAPGLACGGI